MTGHEVGPPSSSEHPILWAVVATYRRPAVLRDTLERLARQSRPPDRVVVVDNAAQRDVASACAEHWATYVPAPDNLGPAGAFTLGVAHVLDRAAESDWILFVDDDDPPTEADDLERLLHWALARHAVDRRVAGVGLEGSQYRRRTGTFRRVPSEELHGVIDLDTLFGDHLPMYRAQALKGVGGPDPRFFWGFEEAELGLHLRSQGFRLVADGDRWRARREARERLESRKPGKTPPDKAAWRRYYSVRNSTELAKRYGRWWSIPYVALGGAAKGGFMLARLGRPLDETVLPLRGAFDGVAGRLGRRVDPGVNAKSVSPRS